MTQDPYGQPPGRGYVVRGEVVADDAASTTQPTAPMTQFQKVASALRGERTDPAMPIPVDPSDPDAPDLSDASDASDLSDASDEADPDVTRPEEVVAVRSPDEDSRDYWDESDETGPKQAATASLNTPAADTPAADAPADAPAASAGSDAAAQDPTMTQPDTYGTSARTHADGVTADADADADAGEPSEMGAAEPVTVGRHAGAPVAADAPVAAGAPAQEGERPGESDRAPGDVTDLTSGSLWPDAAEFRTRWQQVQFRFVDDPRGSVTEAADVIAQVVAKLEAAIQERQHALRDRWDEGQSADTESLRETLLMYRAFLNQLTGSG